MGTTAPKTFRWSLYGVFTVCAIGGAAVAAIAVPSATAAPNPCEASEIARTVGSVSNNTGNYLDSHPDTNTALSAAVQQPPQQALASLKTYFDAHPQVGKDLQTIQQPLAGLTGQCKLPISVPQAMQFLQTMAQSGTLPGGGALPGVGALPAGAPSVTGGYGASGAAAYPPSATGGYAPSAAGGYGASGAAAYPPSAAGGYAPSGAGGYAPSAGTTALPAEVPYATAPLPGPATATASPTTQ